MDLSAPFKPEVLRPVVTIIVPGTIACGPFVLIAGHYIPQIQTFWSVHPTAFAVLLTLAIIGVGFVIDDVGAGIEYHAWDPLLRRRDANHTANWHRYLKLQLKDEIIGQRYLRIMFTQLKFELAMMPALIVFCAGLMWLDLIHNLWSIGVVVIITFGVAAADAYLLFESWQTAGVLSKTRALILEAVDQGVKGLPAPRSPGA